MIPCVILCGGKSSRMGRDKALLPFPLKPLAIYMSKKLSPFLSKVYLSLKDPAPFALYDPLVIVEGGEEFAPMIGIREAFAKIESEKIFFISVDTPFVTQEAIDSLLLAESQGITYAKDTQKEHYLCGIYSKAVVPKLEEMIEKKDYKMSSFVHSLPHHSIIFDDPCVFANLNTPEQYAQALQRIEQDG